MDIEKIKKTSSFIRRGFYNICSIQKLVFNRHKDCIVLSQNTLSN